MTVPEAKTMPNQEYWAVLSIHLPKMMANLPIWEGCLYVRGSHRAVPGLRVSVEILPESAYLS